MIKNWLTHLFLISAGALSAQVGIQTSQVAPSAILEINTNDLPVGNKKGFLGSRIALTGNTDKTTVPSPAVGVANL